MEIKMMKKTSYFKCLSLVLGALIGSGTSQAESLLEVYQQALQSDPLIHEADARRLAAEEAAPQARSRLFPQIQANAGWNSTDSSGNQLITDTTAGIVSAGFEADATSKSWDIGYGIKGMVRCCGVLWCHVVSL